MTAIKGPYEKLLDSQYLHNADLLDDEGKPKPPVKVVISDVVMETVGQKQEKKLVIYLKGSSKGWIPARCCLDEIAKKHGRLVQDWTGKEVKLVWKGDVFFGKAGCIRVIV